MVVIVAWVGNEYIQQELSIYLENSKERSKVIEVLQEIDNNLRDANSALEDLILVPDEKVYLDDFYSSISQANITISAVIELDWNTSDRISQDLSELLVSANTVEEVVLLEFSDEFSGDIEIISDKTLPIMSAMLDEIVRIENVVRDLFDQDLSRLNSSKQFLIKSIIFVTSLGLLVILSVFITTNRYVFQPLRVLTAAFNKEALGEEADNLALPKHIEMKQLIQAFTNMRDQVKLRQAQLEHQALHDGLTGLPNRILLLDRVNQLLKDSMRNNKTPAVIVMDLDRFKEINDTLGHHVGDTLLQEISRRLLNVLRDLDTIARLGGDEFAIVLHDINLEGCKVVAKKITNALAMPIQIEDHQLLIRCSQGIAIFPEHGETDADLLKHADIAMYTAKRGHLGHCIYDPDENHHDISCISLSADLTNAIKKNDLELYYQPKVDSKSGKVVAAEALLRWNHPEKGFVSPELIIEVAEQSGLIQPLTDYVIKTAIGQAGKWQKQGIDICVGVNLSVFNLRSPNLVSTIRSLLAKSSLKPEKLMLEVTESAMMLNPELAANVLTQLSNMGTQISIDDFGTGYSSLAYLKNLPVHELKIDKSFVMNIVNDKSDLSIVKSTIDLAHNLGLSVVAEGVENKESWDILNELDCDILQGYFFSKPIPVEEFDCWIKEYRQGMSKGNKKSRVARG